MNTWDTSDDIWGGDMWGQYIIIDMDEEEKQEKKCEKKNKYTKYTNYKKSFNKKLRNVSRMDCIDEEEWSNMEMGNMEMGLCGDDERNYLIPHGKKETLMDVMRSICTITWIMCSTLINRQYEMKID